MSEGFRGEKLRRDHPVDGFACGQPELDCFLIRYALSNQQANASQTYLGLADAEVAGFYTLVVGQGRARRGTGAGDEGAGPLSRADHAAGALGRRHGLARARAWRRATKDAMRRTMQAAEIGGIRTFVTHAKDEAARRFYEHFGFMPSPTDPLHLFVLVKDIRGMIAD